ncbi:MAG: DUF4373 domain-containing protein [Dethiobacter sp.]|jgi:hypothetical protein|nr:MAG: DUF4373 domain-containing protein [Dethiobacter sp.]
MARPIKEGMDYFPHDTDAANDEKIEALRALYGNDGYAFYFILLERIYRTSSFELDICDAETMQILANKVAVTPELFDKMLQTALKVGCFDRQAYGKKNVLTSNGIKKRAEYVKAKRKKMRDKYHTDKTGVSGAETGEETGAETPQSKVKESKEKESKENKSNRVFADQVAVALPPVAIQKNKKSKTSDVNANNKKINYRDYVRMTADEYQQLLQKYGTKQTEAMLDILDNYKGSRGRTYKDDCRAIESWVVRRYHEDQRRGVYHGEARPYPGAGTTGECSDLREFIQNCAPPRASCPGEADDDMH